MLIFLLWQRKDAAESSDPRRAAPRLEKLFAPIFSDPPEVGTWSSPTAELAWLELPVPRWKPPFRETIGGESAGARFAMAGEYPIGAARTLRGRGVDCPEGQTLLRLGEELQAQPQALLSELCPPFSLVWSDGAGNTWAQTDGLGQAQLFEYEDAHVHVVTNRLSALRALGVTLTPVAEEWATRFTLAWFPLDRTGFRGVRYVAPGTRFCFHRGGVKRERFDVLSGWLHPDPMKPADCLELAASSMRGVLEGAMESWDRPNVGLSGGWDSRAVVALLRDLESPMSLRVRGSPERYDVMIASELARIAGLKLRIKNTGGFPSEDMEVCRRSILLALRWQAGNMSTKKHKTFLVRKPHLGAGAVNVMGQHAGLGKADFVVKTRAWELEPDQYEDRLLDVLTKSFEAHLRPELREPVRELIRESYRQADQYGLEGFARLHFFFLFEYTRRWASGAMTAQPGVVVTPYLNPDFIRAAYAYPQEEIRHRPFHRHIMSRYGTDWADVPFEDQATPEDVLSGRIPRVKLKPKHRAFHEGPDWRRPRAYRIYSNAGYWRNIGRPLVFEARKSNSFWTELLDPALTHKANWERPTYGRIGDPLVLAHLLSEAMTGPLDC